MSVLDIIKERRSVRQYKQDSIPEDVLQRVLEAVRYSPSGKNLQPWKFILVSDSSLKQRIAQASNGQHFMAQAPLIVVACGFPDECYFRMGNYMKSWPVDVAIAMEHLILQAQEEGLGTCWIGAFEERDVKSILSIPEDVRVLALTPLGFSDETPLSRGRKNLEDIISYNSF